jgi:hypothetical protein
MKKTATKMTAAITASPIAGVSLARMVAMRERTLSLRGGMFSVAGGLLSMAMSLLLCSARVAVLLRLFSGFEALLLG